VSEFHATNDRKFFDHKNGDLHVYSGASFNIWQPDTGELFARANSDVALGELQRKIQRQIRLKSSAFFGFDWVGDLKESLPLSRPRIAFRGITNPTNTRTCIPCLIPPDVVLTNIAPYVLLPVGHESDEAFLLGLMSSIPFDWYTRRFIETQMNFHFVNAFPIPSPMLGDALRIAATERAGRLAAVDSRFDEWAKAVGVPVGSVKTEEEKQDLIAELDALVALLYGLSEDQVIHIFQTFHRGWDYQPRLDAVLAHYATWKGKA
jgi:hypothetical protein